MCSARRGWIARFARRRKRDTRHRLFSFADGRAGGLLLSSSGWAPLDHSALERPDLLPGWPSKLPRTINMNAIGNALLHHEDKRFGPKIEALIVYNSNPVAVAPDSDKVAAGFAREDLLTIVLEHFQTDTADYADLPATTQLEHLDVHKSYGHTHVMANLPAIQPIGDSRTNTDIFRGLARAMGLTEPSLFETDEQIASKAFRWNDAALAGRGWNELRASGWLKLGIPEALLAEGGFRTPSGKCEFYSERLAREGHDPLPDYLPPYESADRRARTGRVLSAGDDFASRARLSQQQFREHREPAFYGRATIHPNDAEARGIAEGALVRIFNDRGSMQARA